MVGQEGLPGDLESLRKDLITLCESRLRNVERLWLNLEAHIEIFRKLLDKLGKNNESRRAVSSGTVEIDGDQYSINAEFQEETLQLADALDIDEIDAARRLLLGQEEAESLDRSPLACAVINFHEERQSLLDCIRLVLQQAADEDRDEGIRTVLQEVVALVLEINDGQARNGSLFARKCLTAMKDCERWLQSLAERVQRTATLGQTSGFEFGEIMAIQQSSLQEQHGALGAIVTHLVKANYTEVEDFHFILKDVKSLDRWSSMTIHYVPILMSFTAQYGSPEGSANLLEARGISNAILEGRDSNVWALPQLQAAMTTWWLAEYSGWYFDQPIHSPLQGVNLEVEAQTRSEAFFQALRDGAFQCTLSISSQAKSKNAYNPARIGLTRSLLHDAPALSPDSAPLSPYLDILIMEQIENFTAALISYMPDTLRKFKTEEDDQRRRILSGLQVDPQSGVSEQDRHLERFLVIVSYAYDGRADAAAESFWADTDSNYYGFLQWASRRQSTPCIAAFCEMLMAISEGDECASAAHKFLIEEIPITTNRLRRSISLSWAQIFEELDLYASKIREYPAASLPSTHQNGKPRPVDIDEPESPMMLECYLRLMQHFCKNSQTARSWILSQPTFRVIETLFLLCNSTIPSGIRACAYTVLAAILIEKTADLGNYVWATLDLWVSSGFSPILGSSRSGKITNMSVSAEEITFDTIAHDLEESNSFVCLLQELVSPSSENVNLMDALPFPEQLGSSYRMPGIEPYVDMVLGKVFAGLIPRLDDPLQLRIYGGNAIKFACICLETFNENLLILAHNSNMVVEASLKASSLATYARLHPFSRVIEWMFNERVVDALFKLVHQDIQEVNNSTPNSPLLEALLHCIKAMTLTLHLQSAYFDIVRPLIKTQTTGHRLPVSNPTLFSFEDSVISNPSLIVDLGLYAGSGHHELVSASLKLLEKFSMSRKLNSSQPSKFGSRLTSNRLIGAVQQNGDLEPIARALTSAMVYDEREVSDGPNTSRYQTKRAILNFLCNTLKSCPDRTTLAHVFLGFNCIGNSVNITADSLFARRMSLFHAILRIIVDYPESTDNVMIFWSLSLKEECVEIVKCLWSSPLTSTYTLAELRASDFFFALWLRQLAIDPTTIWNGHSLQDPEFIYLESALALKSYLRQRCALYEYASTELRLATEEGVPLLQARMISTLLGSTTIEDTNIENLTLFDLLDFLELDTSEVPSRPVTQYLENLDLSVCEGITTEGFTTIFDLKALDQLHALRYQEVHKHGLLEDATSLEKFHNEVSTNIYHYHGLNNERQLDITRIAALKSWVDLATLLIESDDLGKESKSALVVQALQILSPKLALYTSAALPEALILARFLQALLAQLDLSSSVLGNGRAGDVANDRLFQVFRIALRAVHNPDVTSVLREALYNVCYRYLTCMAEVADAPLHRRHSTQAVKTAGETLIDIICDDAYSGEGTCRIAALLLLDALTRLAHEEKSSYMIESLSRTNFIVVLVETINDMPNELRDSSALGESHTSPLLEPLSCLNFSLTSPRNPSSPCNLQKQTFSPPHYLSNPLWCNASAKRWPLRRDP